MKVNTMLKVIMVALVAAILAMCAWGCKKPQPRQIEFRLNEGRNVDVDIWEFRTSPKEVNRYHTGIHNAPHSDYLPVRPGFTYMFEFHGNGTATEGEILVDGVSKGKHYSSLRYP